ncbi:MAG: DUF1318 domain-containing protein [Alphaproteobacteria bacterium]|nr:DUF1318 domain-containing protein [Alphaproteobacteria bacterium]
MKAIKKLARALPLAVAGIALSATLAFAAMTVAQAKSAGLVGERTDGMLGIVSTASPELTELVNTTNAQRLEKYKAIAKKRGTDLNHVEAYAGRKLINLAQPGEYVMNPAGGWQKK